MTFTGKFLDPIKCLYTRGSNYEVWTVEIHLTTRCNYQCGHCNWGQRNKQIAEADPRRMSMLLEDCEKMLVRGVIFSGGGEPLLWKKFGVVDLIKGLRGQQVALLTNASLFSLMKDFEWLHNCTYVLVSWHGHQQMRTLAGVAKVVDKRDEIGAKCMINVKMVITPQNYREVVEDYKIIRQITSPDYILFCPSKDYENIGGIELSSQQIQELKGMIEDAGIREDEDSNADILWQLPDRDTPTQTCESIERGLHAYITSDGNVYLCCCLAGNPNFSIGNINQQRFTSIWRGKKHRNLIEKINEDTCKRPNCRFKVYNRILQNSKLETPPLEEYFLRHGGIL